MLKRIAAVATAALAMTMGLTATAAADEGRRSYIGEIDGAEYRVEMPADWNGTLLLYSHGYAPAGFGMEHAPIALTDRPMPFGQPSEDYLLDAGYALAASNFKDVVGYQVKQGQEDQLKLLAWIKENVGEPERTIATGQSLGGVITTELAEKHPEKFDGVATFCAGYDAQNTWNTALDLSFAIKTLLGADIKLVGYRSLDGDAQTDWDRINAAVDEAATTAEGRAKLALIGALGNITGWYSARYPEPANDAEFLDQQKEWVKGAYGLEATRGRVDLEQLADGNPSSNVGIDYTRQLLKSDQTDRVLRAYRESGADLRADLDALADAPRIAADPAAERFMEEYGVADGTLQDPMITVHSTGDGGALTDQERWYAGQVRRHGTGDVRNTWVHRGGHCTISAAEEITALEAIDQRVRTGHWPQLNPRALNAAAEAKPENLHWVYDFSSAYTPDEDAPDTPKFTHFQPPKPQRPSR